MIYDDMKPRSSVASRYGTADGMTVLIFSVTIAICQADTAQYVVADRGYDSEQNNVVIENLGIQNTIIRPKYETLQM